MIRIISTTIFWLLLFLMWGCSANNPGNDQELKKEQLEEYKAQMTDLQKKIKDLESELAEDAPANVVNVEVMELKPTLYEQYIKAIGNVSTDQNVMVSPETSGPIQSIRVKEGDKVTKGQILASLNTESIEQSIAEIEVNLQLASTMYERRKNLWDQNIGSEVEFLQAESNMNALEKKLNGLRAQLEMAVIKAPLNGIVDQLMQNQGEMAGPAIPFARIVNLDQVYITANVSEKYLTKIKAGDSISIYFPVLDLLKEDVIFRTSSIIDPDSRTFSLRINLNNKDLHLQPNLMGELKMRISRLPDALVVPSLLIKKDFNGEFIFIAEMNENDHPVAQKRYITTSIKDNNETVVTSGLAPGVRIITKGYAQVTDGTFVNLH